MAVPTIPTDSIINAILPELGKRLSDAMTEQLKGQVEAQVRALGLVPMQPVGVHQGSLDPGSDKNPAPGQGPSAHPAPVSHPAAAAASPAHLAGAQGSSAYGHGTKRPSAARNLDHEDIEHEEEDDDHRDGEHGCIPVESSQHRQAAVGYGSPSFFTQAIPAETRKTMLKQARVFLQGAPIMPLPTLVDERAPAQKASVEALKIPGRTLMTCMRFYCDTARLFQSQWLTIAALHDLCPRDPETEKFWEIVLSAFADTIKAQQAFTAEMISATVSSNGSTETFLRLVKLFGAADEQSSFVEPRLEKLKAVADQQSSTRTILESLDQKAPNARGLHRGKTRRYRGRVYRPHPSRMEHHSNSMEPQENPTSQPFRGSSRGRGRGGRGRGKANDSNPAQS